jgi:glutathione synthase/RimK-type ligase-like ATP-grasp enzyme
MAEVVEAAAEIPGYRVIVKPVTGLLSRGVRVVRKKDLKPTAEQGNYLVQEYIDTSRGDQDLGIEGVHNLRLYSIDSNLVGAVAKVGGQRKSMLIKAAYGGFFTPEDLPAEVHAVAEQVHGKLKQLPGDGRNVIAIDLMRGRSSTRQDGYVICEINERPYRISSADIGDPDIYNPNDMMWLAKEWDKAEAEMLTSIIKQEVGK